MTFTYSKVTNSLHQSFSVVTRASQPFCLRSRRLASHRSAHRPPIARPSHRPRARAFRSSGANLYSADATARDAAMNEYEARRDARIARNRAILAQLVGDLPYAMMTAPTGGPRASTGGSGKKRPRATINEEDLRRSGRIRNLPAPIYTTFERDDDLGDQNSRSRSRVVVDKQTTATSPRAPTKDRYAGTSAAGGIVTTKSTHSRFAKPAAPLSANSLRALDAEMSKCSRNHLGRPISDGTGGFKAAVVHEISPIANPKFSKMSGIQEWRNVVTLFVNVGDKHGNSYDNVFTHCGGRITWFAQPRQGEDTPVIQRIVKTKDGSGMDALALATAPAGLIPGDEEDEDVEEGEEGTEAEAETGAEARAKAGAETGAEAETETGTEAEAEAGRGKGRRRRDKEWPVHLFCRMEGCEYVYCGRLRTIDHDPNARPMKFTFRLLDAPLLRTSDDFLGLVDLADADADPGLGGAGKKARR